MYSLYISDTNISYRKQSGSSSPIRAAVKLWIYLENDTKRFGLGCTLWWMFRLSWGLIFKLGDVNFTNCSSIIFYFNGITIYQQEEGYVLSLHWGGIPVRMSCPVRRQSLYNPPRVTCNTAGMVVNTDWASPVQKIQVNCMYFSMECLV